MPSIDDLTAFFGDFFNNQQAQEAFQEDPEGFLNQNGFGNISAFEVEAAANRAFAPDLGATTAASAGGAGGGGGGVLHPLPDREALAASPDGGGFSAVQGAIEHYTNVYNTTYDNDQAFDTSTNNNITAFGSDIDLDQDIDTNIASGDGAVAGVEDSQVQTGDGVQAGGDIEGNVVQGDVEDSVLVGDDVTDSQILNNSDVENSAIGSDVDDSVLGNAEDAIVGSDVDDSAISFGEGDAINAENVAQGGGTVVDGDIDGNANIGDGTQVVAGDDLNASESAFGEGASVESNDIAIEADDGSAVALGDGDASGSNQDVDVTNDDGTVQVAGDDAALDQSLDLNYTYETEDSFNTEVDQSVDVEDSVDTNVAQAADDAEVLD